MVGGQNFETNKFYFVFKIGTFSKWDQTFYFLCGGGGGGGGSTLGYISCKEKKWTNISSIC